MELLIMKFIRAFCYFLLGSDILLWTIFRDAHICDLFVVWETKFQTKFNLAIMSYLMYFWFITAVGSHVTFTVLLVYIFWRNFFWFVVTELKCTYSAPVLTRTIHWTLWIAKVLL